MNRVRGAILLLLLLAAFAIWGHICVQSITDQLDSGLAAAHAALHTDDLAAARQQVDALQRLCREKQHLLTIFVKRDLVNTLYTGLAGVEDYLQADYVQDAHLELARAAAQVQAIRWQYFDIA